MESNFTMCPACETMLKGDEAECPNCGTQLTPAETSAPANVREGDRMQRARLRGGGPVYGEDALFAPGPSVQRYRYLVIPYDDYVKLQDGLNVADAYGWELVNTYFGDRYPGEPKAHYMVVRRRTYPPLDIETEVNPDVFG